MLHHLSLRLQGKYAEAEQVAKESLYIGRALYGNAHPYVKSVLDNLKTLLRAQVNSPCVVYCCGIHSKSLLPCREKMLRQMPCRVDRAPRIHSRYCMHVPLGCLHLESAECVEKPTCISVDATV